MLFTYKATFCTVELLILLGTKYPKETSCGYEAVSFVKAI